MSARCWDRRRAAQRERIWQKFLDRHAGIGSYQLYCERLGIQTNWLTQLAARIRDQVTPAVMSAAWIEAHREELFAGGYIEVPRIPDPRGLRGHHPVAVWFDEML